MHPSAPNQVGRVGLKLLLAVASLLLALLAAEVGHRLYVYGPGGLSPTRLESVHLLGEGVLVDSEFQAIDYELAPNVRMWHMLHPFETNSEGQREDREYAREKPAGTFRVAVLGDSYAMGWGVPVEAIYHSRLEEQLAREDPSRRVEFINFGVAGYNLLHYAAVLEHKVLAWEPDLILLSVIVNDEPAPGFGYLRKLYPEREDLAITWRVKEQAPPEPFLRMTLLDTTIRRLNAPPPREPESADVIAARAELCRVLAIRAAEGDPDEDEYVDAAFARIAALAGEVPVFCAYLSTADNEYRRSSARRFEAAAEAVGFGFLDTCPLARGLSRRQAEILPTDNHPTIEMHARYAEGLRTALEDGGWLGER